MDMQIKIIKIGNFSTKYIMYNVKITLKIALNKVNYKK